MRVTRLTLDRYGAFSDLTVKFSPGLTVVHGPNEAGKSTLTHAIGDVLWGLVGRQHRYAFEVAPARLQVTADVDGATGPQTLTVTSRGRRDAAGALLEPSWPGGAVTSREAWALGYGLDRDRLRLGGRAVLRDGGDLADLLFQARTGVDLAAARDRLIGDADRLWKRHRGARGELRTMKERVDELAGRFADALRTADHVAALAEELRRAERDLEAARAAHSRTDAAKQAAQRDARAHPAAVALGAIRGRIEEASAAGDHLSATDLDRYDEVTADLAEAQRSLRDIEGDEAALDATPLPAPDPDALGVGDLVDELRRGEDAETDRRRRVAHLDGESQRLLRDLREAATELDPSVVVADDADLRRAAAALLLPAATIDLLDRLADGIEEARREVDDARSQMQVAESELIPEEADGRRIAHSRWEAARQVRDRAWQQVREPWLAGELLAPGVRASLAADLDGALSATDVAAGEAALEAEQLVEAQTRAEERERRLDAARQKHSRLADSLDVLAEEWQRTVRSCGIVLDVPAWRRRCSAAQRVSELLLALADNDRQAGELRGASRTFGEQVALAVRSLGIEPSDSLSALTAAHRRVTAARQAHTASAERERQRSTLVGKRARAETNHQQAEQALAAFVARAPEGDLDALVQRSRHLLELRRQELAVLDRLRAAAPDDDPDDLVARLSGLSSEEVAQALGAAEDDAADAIRILEEATERRARLSGDLRTAQTDRHAAVLHQQRVEALDDMAELARRWVQLRLMAGVLDRVVRAAGSQADASLLEHAGSLARRLTGGRVLGLSAADWSGDSETLRVQLVEDLDVSTGGLSEGTADQVFLALRLAGIRQRQDAARADGVERLPVVLDDILMAHDDERTEAALGVLVDEARDQQIILFTHHRAVAEAARRAGAAVVELDGRAELASSAPADPVDPASIRSWARARGLEVSARGRIPNDVVAAYRASQAPALLVGE